MWCKFVSIVLIWETPSWRNKKKKLYENEIHCARTVSVARDYEVMDSCFSHLSYILALLWEVAWQRNTKIPSTTSWSLKVLAWSMSYQFTVFGKLQKKYFVWRANWNHPILWGSFCIYILMVWSKSVWLALSRNVLRHGACTSKPKNACVIFCCVNIDWHLAVLSLQRKALELLQFSFLPPEIKEPRCHSVSNSKCLKTSQHITNWGRIDDFSVYRFSLYEAVEQEANFIILFFELHI